MVGVAESVVDPNRDNPRGSHAPAAPWDLAVQIFNEELTNDGKKRLSLDSCPRSNLQSFIEDAAEAQKESSQNKLKPV